MSLLAGLSQQSDTVSTHNDDPAAHMLDATPSHPDATGINSGKAFLRLPPDTVIRGTSNDGLRDLALLRIWRNAQIEAENLDILLFGDSRMTHVSFAAPIDCVGNHIIDPSDVGNQFGLYSTRLVQKFADASLTVGVATLGETGCDKDRITVDNLVDVATASFRDTDIKVGQDTGVAYSASFESIPAGWASDAANLSIVAGGASGNCLQIEATGSGGCIFGNIPTKTGANYTLSIRFKKTTGGNGIILAYKVVDGVAQGAPIATATGLNTTSWTEYTLNFTATSAAVMLLLTSDSSSGITLWESLTVTLLDGGGKVTAKQLIATEILSLLGYQVSFGANDSAGSGYRQLRVANA